MSLNWRAADNHCKCGYGQALNHKPVSPLLEIRPEVSHVRRSQNSLLPPGPARLDFGKHFFSRRMEQHVKRRIVSQCVQNQLDNHIIQED